MAISRTKHQAINPPTSVPYAAGTVFPTSGDLAFSRRAPSFTKLTLNPHPNLMQHLHVQERMETPISQLALFKDGVELQVFARWAQHDPYPMST